MSDSSVRILVIEDNLKHLQDANDYASNLIRVSVDFTTTLADALLLLKENIYRYYLRCIFS